jgi:putative IMPACT (imprinted ancient) family translation regulator
VLSYRTITSPSDEILYKDKGSKFFGYAFPIKTDDEVKEFIKILKQKGII